jgi:CheY-like chemotaxis protein
LFRARIVLLSSVLKTILLVDDELAIVEVLTGILEDEGYRLIHAANGREAIAVIEQGQPDLVLLDLMMPIMDGRETLAAIRADARLSSLPVMLMSAAAPPDDIERDHRTRFLRKPFDIDEMLRQIVEMIAGAVPEPSG